MQDQAAGGTESWSSGNPGDDGGRARFLQRLAAAEAARGDRDFLTLVEADGQTLTFTYPMLRENAAAWAERYRAAGLVAGERIVIILNQSPALYASFLGALLGGYCPAFFAPPSEKTAQADYARSVGQLLAQIGAEIVVTDHDLRRRLGNEIGWFRGFTEAGAFCEMGCPPLRPAADQSAPYLFLQFSSGTTGIKKGVGISAEKLLCQVDAYAKELEIGSDARIATWLPLYHDMGLITCYFLPLLLGIPMIAVSPFDWVRQPAILLDMISLTRATHCWLPNFAFNFLATRLPPSEMRDWDLGCIEALVNCSEPIHAESHRLFLDRFAPHGIRPAMICTCYAMAETTFAVTSSASLADGPLTEIVDPNTLNRDLLVKTVAGTGRPTVTSGRALPGTDIRILSTLNAPLPEGHLGEIAVRSPSRFDGYLGRPDAGADQQSHFSTGDLGYMRNGELFVVGRIKDTIIIGGKNIYPQDIEAVCNEVEGVRPGRCVAFGVDNPELGTESLIVIVEAMSDEAASREKVRARVFQAIVVRTDATPADVIAVPHMYLRKSTSGKISRSKNRETYLAFIAKQARPKAAVATADVAEITDLVRKLVLEIAIGPGGTGPDQIGDDTPLLTQGWIDSFSFTTLLLQVEDRFGPAVSAALRSEPNRHQTIARIAALIEAGGSAVAVDASETDNTVEQLPADDPRQILAPQLSDVDQQPYAAVAYIMRRGEALYRSPSTNTDRIGCRITWKRGQPIDGDSLKASRQPRGIVLGNSFAFGVGTTHDSAHVASQLNEIGAGGNVSWMNFALRGSNLTQERLFFELYAEPTVAQVLWISGINNLINLIIDEGIDPNPAPYMGERAFVKASMPNAKLEPPAGTSVERYRGMLRIAEIDISAIAMRQAGFGPVTFCLQPSATWIKKPMTDEESTLIDGFDRHGATIRAAHHPKHLAIMHALFSRDIKAICDKWGVGFIDLNLSPRLRSPAWLFLDRIHMNDRGHRIVAEDIAHYLAHPANQLKERRTAS